MTSYSKNISLWDKLASTHESTIPCELIRANLGDLEALRVLDIGCGYGRVMSWLAADLPPRSLVGIDASPNMIRRCRDSGLLAVVGSIRSLPFPSNNFDVVLVVAVLSSIVESDIRSQIIREASRVLCRPGKILVADFLISYKPKRFLRYLMHVQRNMAWGSFTSEEGIRFKHFKKSEIAYFFSLNLPHDLLKPTHPFHAGRYTNDWHQISQKTRTERGNKCEEEECGSSQHLQVHHINGVKDDNTPRNLKVLCYYHHSQQSFHQHMMR